MDERKIRRHIRTIMDNIFRMNVHYEYAQHQLVILIQELEGSEKEQKKWDAHLQRLNKIRVEELNDIDWEKELERYTD